MAKREKKRDGCAREIVGGRGEGLSGRGREVQRGRRREKMAKHEWDQVAEITYKRARRKHKRVTSI